MGIIELKNMEFYAYHGHFQEERTIGNKYKVSLKITTDLSIPSKTDLLEDTVNYRSVYDLVVMEMKKKSHLLENIASRIIDTLYNNFKNINEITVKVSKLNPPMGGIMDSVSVILKK